MQPQEFLAAVLPSEGLYCTVELSTKKREHRFVGDLIGLEEGIRRFELEEKNTYFALASFVEPGSREALNAASMRAVFLDIDCGPGKAYDTKRLAVEALHKFLGETKLAALGAPWLVDSGGGVHVYWPLDEDAPIAAWKPVAEAFKRKAKELGFKIDMTVTADAARVLRPPGTTNWKYDPPRPVVLKHLGSVFSLQDIADCLDVSSLPGTGIKGRPPTPTTIAGTPPKPRTDVALANTTAALAKSRATLFKNILVKTMAGTGCAQVANYVQHAQDDGMEPLWRGMLSLTKYCDDGYKAALKLSAMHPYPVDRMELKLSEIKGPYSCAKLDSENPGVCDGCRHANKITNPLALGWEVPRSEANTSYADTSPGATVPPHAAHLIRPPLPRGYFLAQNGGTYRLKETEVDGEKDQQEVQILPFDFFMVDMLQEGSSYASRFAAVRQNSIVYATVPNKSAGSKDEVIKALATQNIIAAHGAGNDKNLYDYVRACIAGASAADSALRVPPKLGWQPDGSYAIADQVLQQGGASYTYVSERLMNIVNSTTTKGSLGEWQRVVEMLKAKELYGVLTLGMIGFGSPLMEWVGDGTPGMIFHACGRQSGAGKSLALALAASVWGSPTNYPVKPTTSERTILQRAGLLGNSPLLIDEVTSKSRKSEMEWLPEFVFDFSQGGHKLKGSGSSNSELTNDLFWRSLGLVTSNAPAMEHMMGARDTSSEGEVRRMLEWRTEDRLYWSDAERDLLPLLGANYGAAGRKYAAWLVDNQDVAKEVLADTVRRWRKALKAEDSERFWTAGCSAVLAGCILAGPKYANVCDVPSAPVFKFLRSLVEEARKIIDINAQNALDVLNAYTREFHGQFVKIGPASNSVALFTDGRQVRADSTRGRIAGRIEYDVNPGWEDYFIEVNMLKRYCSVRNWSFMELQKQLAKYVLVRDVRKDLLAKTGSPAMRVACLQISRPIGADDGPGF
jgi:hypothetical protein